MGFHGLDAGSLIGFPLSQIFDETRLEETIFSLDCVILCQILTKINDFQLVTTG